MHPVGCEAGKRSHFVKLIEPPQRTVAVAVPPGEGAKPGVAVYVSGVAALGGLLFGYDSAVINGAVGAIGTTFGASPATLGLAVSSVLIGAAVGALLVGPLADNYGRLLPMRLAALLFIVSALGAMFTNSLLVLSIFRVIGGLGLGVASVIAPAYIAEIAPAELRGRLGSLQQLAIVTGIFISLLVDFALSTAAGGATAPWLFGLGAWRWMFGAMVVPAVAYGLLSYTIPESPRFLIAKGRTADARSVLAHLLGSSSLEEKTRHIQDSLHGEGTSTWRDLRGPAMGLLPIVWVGIGLSVFQQFVGINVIFYYSTVLWHAVGFSEKNSLVITVITSVVNIVSTFIAIALIDKIGRRPLLLIGSAGMAVTLGVLAFVFGNAPLNAQHQPFLDHTSGLVALWAANVFVVAFAMSWGPVVWVLLGEKFPNQIRAAALSLAACAQWIANWVITVSFPTLQHLGLGLAYGVYTTFAVLSFVFVLRFVKESNGRELENMSS
jgi:SP family sugar:H+ symporter-like MFS transporter